MMGYVRPVELNDTNIIDFIYNETELFLLKCGSISLIFSISYFQCDVRNIVYKALVL